MIAHHYYSFENFEKFIYLRKYFIVHIEYMRVNSLKKCQIVKMNAQIDHVLSIENRLVFRRYSKGDREF